jgi:hypothetical protein
VFSTQRHSSSGFALLTVLYLIAVMASLFSAYMVLTRTELALVKTTRDSASGFNAAEAGLNLRAEEIRSVFFDFDFPEGTSPLGVAGCDAGSNGTGDYVCREYNFGNSHSAMTYISEAPSNPEYTIIPPGEAFAGLNAQEYRYTVTSVGRNNQESNEAILDLTFKSRVVPMFQFAIFFNEDLEFFNGATMTIDGPVHTNGDLYLSPQDGGATNYTGQLTLAGTFYRGQKSQATCTGYTGTASVKNPTTYVNLPECSGSRRTVTDVDAWNDNIILDVDEVSVPSPEDMDAFSDGEYWKRADLRLALRLTGAGLPDTSNSSTGVEVVDIAGNNVSAATSALHNSGNCPGMVQTAGGPGLAVGTQGPGTTGNQLRMYREYQYSTSVNSFQRTLEIDMRALLNCIHKNSSIMGGRLLNDETEQGLVFHLTVDGPNSNASHNNYAVRIQNGSSLQSNIGGAATVKGLTLVSDQSLVVWGNYNSSGWIPAALMADTLYLLSTGWVDSDSYLTNRYDRDGSATAVYAAVLSGIKQTGNANGPAGQDHGADTNGGGAINVFRFNEWFRVGSSSIPNFTYVGSIVSLGAPLHSQSSWGPFTYYSAPNRVWSFDERFNDADQLPPMTPAFIYLRQELFVRNYEL